MSGSSNASAVWERYAEELPLFDHDSLFTDIYKTTVRELSGTYLDLGAGDGNLLRMAFREGMLERYHTLLACEISEQRVARIAAEPLPGLKAFAADSAHLPLPSGSVDFIVSRMVIEHVPDDKAMAREIARVLAPNGRALVSSVVKRWYGWYFYRNNGKWRLDTTHIREYASLAEYEQVFRDAGLVPIASHAIPTRFPVNDLLVRAMMKVRKLDRRQAESLFARLRGLEGLRIPVPGYRDAEVLVKHA